MQAPTIVDLSQRTSNRDNVTEAKCFHRKYWMIATQADLSTDILPLQCEQLFSDSIPLSLVCLPCIYYVLCIFPFYLDFTFISIPLSLVCLLCIFYVFCVFYFLSLLCDFYISLVCIFPKNSPSACRNLPQILFLLLFCVLSITYGVHHFPFLKLSTRWSLATVSPSST